MRRLVRFASGVEGVVRESGEAARDMEEIFEGRTREVSRDCPAVTLEAGVRRDSRSTC